MKRVKLSSVDNLKEPVLRGSLVGMGRIQGAIGEPSGRTRFFYVTTKFLCRTWKEQKIRGQC